MSPIESNMLPDFEREIYINMLLKELEEESNPKGNKI